MATDTKFMFSYDKPDYVSEHSCSSPSLNPTVVMGCLTLVAGLITGRLTMYCVFKRKSSSTHHHQPEQEQVNETSNRAMYEEITSIQPIQGDV